MFALRIFLVGTKQGTELTNLMNYPRVYESLEGKRNCVGVPYSNEYLSIMNLYWKIDCNQSFSLLMNNERISSLIGKIIQLLSRLLDFFGKGEDSKVISFAKFYYIIFRDVEEDYLYLFNFNKLVSSECLESHRAGFHKMSIESFVILFHFICPLRALQLGSIFL